MSAPPILFQWTGEAMSPVGRFASECDRHFVIGARYRLEEMSERSDASHKHEFAWLREAWANLPEELADQFPTVEHLRKRALIQAGYHHETVTDCGSNAAALRVAAMVRNMDQFAYAVVRGPLCVVRTAESQSRRTMDKARFQDSKTKIMEIVADLVGVTPETLNQNAERAA
jgi:hypothetical protein